MVDPRSIDPRHRAPGDRHFLASLVVLAVVGVVTLALMGMHRAGWF